MSNKEACFEYKCRRCGRIKKGGCCGDTLALRILIALQSEKKPIEFHNANSLIGTPTSPTGLCNCKDGGTGISDLIGFFVK